MANGYPWKLISLNVARMAQLTAACRAADVSYGLGSKAPSLDSEPGTGFKRIDCSGFVRWLIWKASGRTVRMPDGSWIQHEWIREHGFKQSTVEAGKLLDGRVRVAIMTPHGGGVGHIALIHNGRTMESHGGKGPDRRPWTGNGWQAKCSVYVLADASASD